MMQYSAIKYSTMQYSKNRCNTVKDHAVQSTAVRYYTLHFTVVLFGKMLSNIEGHRLKDQRTSLENNLLHYSTRCYMILLDYTTHILAQREHNEKQQS